MYDKKQIRRRRAVLGVLVAASLVLLTAYFGESPSSPLHQVQQGIVEVLSPIQEGASKVLSPVRDVASWFSDTLKAKSQVAGYRREVAQLTLQVAELQNQALENQQLRQEVHLDGASGLNAYNPVAANVYARDSQLWYSQMYVDKGTADGVHPGDPVIGEQGLVGKVLSAGSTASVVTLITDHTFAACAKIEDTKGDYGLLVPETGNPSALQVTELPSDAQITRGQLVVTCGFKAGALGDLFPAAIPIGRVTNADLNTLINNGTVQVTPIVDLRRITTVQILTRPSDSAVVSASTGTSTGATQTTAQVGGG